MMPISFTPRGWFWIVGGDETKAWSSATGAYVETFDLATATRIASEEELSDVLRGYGMKVPKPTLDDYTAAVQGVVDATAKAKSYADGVSLASYAASSDEAWAAEAMAFIAWRDRVWGSVYATMAAEQSDQAPPAIDALVAGLPAIAWPSQ